MSMQEIRRLAMALGIRHAQQQDVRALIHHIQFEEGHVPCFCESWSVPCSIAECPFAEACSSNAADVRQGRH